MSETPVRIEIPEFCMVLLVGPSGCGKSTFARLRFAPTEILSSDALRAIVADDEDSAEATPDAIAVLKDVLARRLARRLLTVVDATNLRPEDRAQLLEIAQRGYAPAVAVLFDVPERLCLERNRKRPNPRPEQAVRRQWQMMRKSLGSVKREGFSHVHRIGHEEADAVEFARVRLWTDRKDETGPFDVVGDVHGCLSELLTLLGRLGYAVGERVEDGQRRFAVSHPEGRRLVFVGDLGDRGPDSVGVFALAMDAAASGAALCVKGNHDLKLLRHLRGREVSDRHGFDLTAAQLAGETEAFRRRLKDFLDRLTSHLVLDGGALAVAHAGVKEAMQARGSRLASDFCMFGETTGEVDEYGLPVRHQWAADYRGKAAVVYGHTPTTEAAWISNTICVDTGCVFGGALTALRWPERELVSVPAEKVWCEPVRPAAPPEPPADRLPTAEALLAKATVASRFLDREVTVQAEQAAAAFEFLATQAADPRWLLFVAPTTATVESSKMDGWLERPEEAFDHYARAGVPKVVVESKHMGSRAVAVVCRDEGVAARRFGDGSRSGIVLSKSGRPFFVGDPAGEAHVLDGLRAAMDGAGLWDRLETDWVALDGELLPWSVKAGSLIRDAFAGTGCAGFEASSAAAAAYRAAAERGLEGADAFAAAAAAHADEMTAFRRAYASFVTPYGGLADLRYAPFHVLAAEGRVFADESHAWHMRTAGELAAASAGLVVPTPWMEIDPASPEDRARAVDWWLELTEEGGEGFIVKGPSLRPGPKGLAPSIKVRGREYLRIIYGASYLRPDVLPGLKSRATGRKRTAARVGLALGLEGLARFVERASLARVHEMVAAAVGIASEPIDARL